MSESCLPPTLVLRSLGKTYARQGSPWQRLKSLITGRAQLGDQWAVQDVSFTLHRGQCIGLVGDNGAGKSTLLKLVAGALRPTTGHMERSGWLTAILELGTGFHPEFTGRQNLYFGGALMGMAEEEIRSLEKNIIAFSELHEAIDRPIKTYSSGMTVRLAFSLVTAKEPDILIIDEALAVGDQHFQKKCVERIDTFRKNGSTILFCSHSLYHVRQLCDQALWLDQGRVRALGATETVLAAYESHVRQLNSTAGEAVAVPVGRAARVPPVGNVARVECVEVANLGEGDPPLLESPDLSVTVTAYVPGDERPNIAVMLERADKVCVTAVGTHADQVHPESLGGGRWRSTVTFPALPLYSGEYVVSVYLFDSLGTLIYEEWLDCQRFMLVYPTLEVGLVRLQHQWS